MRINLLSFTALVFLFVVIFTGNVRSEEEMMHSSEVIQSIEVFKTTSEKVEYLLRNANEFFEDGRYKEAKELSDYILEKLDKNSERAIGISEKAQLKIEQQTIVEVNPVEIKF